MSSSRLASFGQIRSKHSVSKCENCFKKPGCYYLTLCFDAQIKTVQLLPAPKKHF